MAKHETDGAPPGGRALVLGHRGASAIAPENTLAAFGLALEQGGDGFELDVWRCGTGEVVVHHDLDTMRTGGSALRITAASLAELRRLDVGDWKGARFRGERIPLLAEVLEAFPAAVVNVELKSAGFPPDLLLARAVARELRRGGALERCIVSSFDPALLAAFRLAEPRAATGVLFADDRSWRLRAAGALLLRPRAVHPECTLITPARARRWASGGLNVNAWTVDDPGEAARLCALGVSAIVTNRPAEVRRAVRAATGR
jgi:glycerophosphoryl diester phosphodiesterase